jgi:hypothetical protein
MTTRNSEERLAAIEWDERDPENMEKGSGAARRELRILAAARARPQPAARPLVVAYDLSCAEEDNHDHNT